MMKIKSHPTRYGGVQFRSRLEARWAAFFDLCRWPWEYESTAFCGWLPDFTLRGGKRSVYVEVKPIEWRDDLLRQAKEYEGLEKVWTAAAERPVLADYSEQNDLPEILILGAGPIGGTLGVFACEAWGMDPDEAVFDGGLLFHGKDLTVYPIDFHAETGSFETRIAGEHDGDGHLRGDTAHEYVTALWREAGNRTQ